MQWDQGYSRGKGGKGRLEPTVLCFAVPWLRLRNMNKKWREQEERRRCCKRKSRKVVVNMFALHFVLIECVADIVQKHHKVRRLHLVVDLWRVFGLVCVFCGCFYVLGWFLFCVCFSCFASAWRCFDLYLRVRLQYSADCTCPLSPEPGRLHFMNDDSCMDAALIALTFPTIFLCPTRAPTLLWSV